MITEITIRNFRHFEDVSFRPHENVSLLCGLNGTGKSTIVDVLNRLKKLLVHGAPVGGLFNELDIPKWKYESFLEECSGAVKQYIKNSVSIEDDFLKIINKSAPSVVVKASIEGCIYSYICWAMIICGGDDRAVCLCDAIVCGENLSYINIMGSVEVESEGGRDTFKVDSETSGVRLAAKSDKHIKKFLDYFASSIFPLSINPMTIKDSHEKADEHLAFDAQNFPAWYAYNAGKSLMSVVSCFEEYKAFIPGFVEMNQNTTRFPIPLNAIIKLSPEKSYQLPFGSLSHGQKVLCVLHTVIKLAPQGSSILIDEFENYLAPSELVPLYSAMQRAFEEREVQFILVSHHQKTLNWFRDAAFILSFSKDKPAVTIEAFDAEKYGEIYDYLDDLAGQAVVGI